MVINGVFSSEGRKFFYSHLLSFIIMMNLLEYISTKTNLASAGTRAASGRRRPAQNQAFITYLRVPSPRPGTNLNPGLIEDAFTSAALKGGVGDGGPVCRTRSGLGGGCSRRSLLPSRSFRLIRVELGLSSRVPSFSRLGHVSSSSLSPLIRVASGFRVILSSLTRWPSVKSARDDAGRGDAAGVCRAAPDAAGVCRAAPVASLLGLLAELDNVSRASSQCPFRLTGRQSRQPSVCSAAAMANRDRPSVTVATVVSTPIQVMRSAGCRQRRPSIPTTTHGPLVAPKV